MTNRSAWKDYAFESRIRVVRGGVFICVRWSGRSFYNAFLNPNDDWVVFAEWSGRDYQTFGGKNFPIPRNEWFLVRFEVQGDSLKLFIDNQLAAAATRTSYYKGGIGYYMGGGDEVHFDDIRVWQLSEP
jgi:hypothetical protein